MSDSSAPNTLTAKEIRLARRRMNYANNREVRAAQALARYYKKKEALAQQGVTQRKPGRPPKPVPENLPPPLRARTSTEPATPVLNNS